MASATCCTSYGLTSSASLSSSAAPAKRAQDQHALFVVARGDEFLGDQIHAVMQRGDQADVGSAVEACDLVVRVMLLQQDDRHPAAGLESRVDARGFALDFVQQFLIALDRVRLGAPIWMKREAPLVRRDSSPEIVRCARKRSRIPLV